MPTAANTLPIATVTGCMAMVRSRSVTAARAACISDSGNAASNFSVSLARSHAVGVALRWT